MRTPLDSLKPKMLVFLPSSNEVQRFVLGGAFQRAARQFDVCYVLLELDRQKLEPLVRGVCPDAELHFLNVAPERFKLWQKLFNAACYQFATESRSFAIRIDPEYAGEAGRRKLAADRAAVLRNQPRTALMKLISGLPLPVRIRTLLFEGAAASAAPKDLKGKTVMFHPAAYAEFRRQMLKKLKIHAQMQELLNAVDPLMTVIPTSLLDPFCNELLWLSEGKATCLVIQSGWDNLSSKGIILHQPSFMGVWGPQSAVHAHVIQKVARDAVIELGSPHYEALVPREEERSAIRDRLGVRKDEILLLFGGSFRQFDETSTLRTLEAMIEEQGLDMKVLYRPHPYRLDRIDEENFFDKEWKHVLFDEEMKERYLASKQEAGYIKRERPIYSMDYLAGVLSSVDAVVSPMSTLILEAMIMKKPTMGVAFSDSDGVYGASTASEMTHFDAVRKQDAALIWCDNRETFATQVKRLVSRIGDPNMMEAQTNLLKDIITREPGTYAERLDALLRNRIAPAALEAARRRFSESDTISHLYGADHVLRNYAEARKPNNRIPGFYQHGWLPRYYNDYPELVAMHKKIGQSARRHHAAKKEEMSSVPQWVARQDQAETLRANGYRHAEAIGLPFAYLPKVKIRRQPNSVLVMPPNARKKHFVGGLLAEAYADYAVALRKDFEHVYACLNERDYLSGEWRLSLQERGIPVIIGGNKYNLEALHRMKRIFSSFDCVTTNAFGSHIAYAAHCGARVCIDGPFCEWDPGRSNQVSRMYPHLPPVLAELQSEVRLRREFPFLFKSPREADRHQQWGDEQIGVSFRRSPEEIRALFGWSITEASKKLVAS